MSALEEVRRRRYRDDEIVPHTAGAEDPETTPEQIVGMIHSVFNEGAQRRAQLDEFAKRNEAIEHLRDGSYLIKYAHMGTYADFHDQANYKYLKDKYSFLHSVSEGLGFDEDKGADSHGSFEDFLASIPHEDWVAFIEDMDSLENYPLLDEDGASELEMKEVDRWVTEDGGPDLIKEMVKHADNSYDAYLLSKVPVDKVFEWMRETDHYPESQGQGDVWMDMERYAKEDDTREWFLDEMEDDEAGWLEQKRLAYEDGSADKFDALLKRLASEDEQAAHTYNRMDAEAMWQMFLKAFPDERREQDDPYWYLWKPNWNEPGSWKPGYMADTHNPGDWKSGYQQALDDLYGKEWFRKLVRNWFSRGPEGHPEFKFEALEAEPDPDDPEIYMKYGGGLAEEIVYEDPNIVVLYPRNLQTLNYHLVNAGRPEATEQTWRDLFKYKDIFVVQAKLPPDLLGKVEKRELAIIWGDTDVGLRVWTGSIKAPSLQEITSHAQYGRSIRRMLMRYYRERLSSDSKAGSILLQLGGGREVRRAEARGELSRSDLGVALGLYYIDRHKYRLAAKAFNRPLNTMTKEGVWLVYDAVEDLTAVFKNDEAASTVFGHDHYDWFDHYYERSNLPEVKDVLPYLDQSAIDHIKSVMVNRRVYFPDTDEWVVTTPQFLAEYDDATLLDWIANPTDEDVEEGVWDDIREAIQYAGADILSSASQDEVYTGFIKAAVDAIDGKKHKWGSHPTKKYKSGGAMETFEVFVPWKSIVEFAEKYQSEHGYNYDGDLESLAVEANTDTIEPDVNNMEAGWHDVNKDWAKENLHRIHDLKPPEPIPGSPAYVDPAQTELPLKEAVDPDDPAAMTGLMSGIPVELENRVKAILQDSSEAHGYTFHDLTFQLDPYVPHSEEDIDASDGRLWNLPPHFNLRITYRTEPETNWEVQTWVFRKVREQVINTMRWYDLKGDHLINPQTWDLSEDYVILYFTLWPKPEPKPEAEPEPGEVPF